MAHRHRLVLALGAILTGLPLTGEAIQIAPNPNPAGSTINIINDTTAVNDTPFTNDGTVNLNAGSVLTSSRPITNNGTILINDSSRLGNLYGGAVTPPSVPSSTSISSVTNHGTMLINDSSTLDGGGSITNSGTIHVTDASRVSVGGVHPLFGYTSFQNSGTFTVDATSQFSILPDSFFSNSGTITNDGRFDLVNVYMSNSGTGTFTNNGTLHTYSSVGNVGTLINNGALSANGLYNHGGAHQQRDHHER